MVQEHTFRRGFDCCELMQVYQQRLLLVCVILCMLAFQGLHAQCLFARLQGRFDSGIT